MCITMLHPTEVKKTSIPHDELQMDLVHHMQVLVGILLFLAISTRPDITFAVCFLARFTTTPPQSAYTAAKRILRYLKSSMDFGITYHQRSQPDQKYMPFHVHVDAWTRCEITRKWTTGYVIFLNNSPIHWLTKRQSLVALSTTEGELIALSEATTETLWLRSILLEMDLIKP